MVEALKEKMVAGAVVNQVIFNETSLRRRSKQARAQVEMIQPLLYRIKEMGSSWGCGAALSY